MSIFDILSNKSKQAEPSQEQQQSQQSQASGNGEGNNSNKNQQQDPNIPGFQQSQNSDPNTNSQNGGQESNSGDSTFSLEDLEKLFDNKDTGSGNGGEKDNKNKANKSAEEQVQDFFTYDKEKLQEGIKGQNFVNIDNFEELSTEALRGDTKAFSQILNSVAQSVFTNAAELSAGISNKATNNAYQRSMEELPKSIRSHTADDNLAGINSKYMSKGLAPMTNLIKKQVETNYPDASSKEIAELVNNYMRGAVSELSSDSDPTQRSDRNPEKQFEAQSQDFQSFFSS